MKNALRNTLAAGALIGVATLAACGVSATNDRPSSDGGDKPDNTLSAEHVTVYLNANNVPNVAIFCTGTIAWGSTLSGGDSGKDKASALVRLPEQDVSLCGAKAN